MKQNPGSPRIAKETRFLSLSLSLSRVFARARGLCIDQRCMQTILSRPGSNDFRLGDNFSQTAEIYDVLASIVDSPMPCALQSLVPFYQWWKKKKEKKRKEKKKKETAKETEFSVVLCGFLNVLARLV